MAMPTIGLNFTRTAAEDHFALPMPALAAGRDDRGALSGREALLAGKPSQAGGR
jgi:hypothetical protein